MVLELIKKAEETHNLSKQELLIILDDKQYNQELFQAADRVRRNFVGDEVHLRGLIEFSNQCKQNCQYCGLRRDNREVKRYRLEPQQIIDFATDAKKYGYKTVVLQSAEDEYYTVEIMQQILTSIKALEMAITLSIGEKSFEEYQAYKIAGADRFLIRIETTDKELYQKHNPGMSWNNRLRCLQDLGKLGYEVGSGSLIGLPGQTIASIADDILFFKEINADMIGIGPFIPHPHTPLKDAQGGSLEMALKVMALTRLLLPDINIPATTAMETLHPDGRIMALQSGANVIMPNVTEGGFRKFYELYPGKIGIDDLPVDARSCIEAKIYAIDRSISTGFGFSHPK